MNKVEWKFPMTFWGNKDDVMTRKDDVTFSCSKTEITGTIIYIINVLLHVLLSRETFYAGYIFIYFNPIIHRIRLYTYQIIENKNCTYKSISYLKTLFTCFSLSIAYLPIDNTLLMKHWQCKWILIMIYCPRQRIVQFYLYYMKHPVKSEINFSLQICFM